MRRHRILLALAIPALVSMLPGEANAVLYNGNCEEGETCIWMDSDFQNCMYDGWDEADFRKVHYATCRDKILNDTVSSYKNLSSEWYILSEHPNGDKGGGAHYCIAPHATGNIQPGFNDKASAGGTAPPEDFPPEAVRKFCKFVDTD